MSIQALRERVTALSKEANHLLAEKGAQVWSKEDQAKFDGLTDEIERGQRQIEAHQRTLDDDAQRTFRDAPRKEGNKKLTAAEEGMEIFLRKALSARSPEEHAKVQNTMSTTTGSEGGYSVQPQIATQVIDLLKSYSYMRKVADNITTSSGVDLSWPTTDGTAEVGEIIAQNTSATASDPTFGTRTLNTVKFGSKIITVPIELLQDSQIDVTALVMRRMRDRVGRIQNLKYSVGTGSGEPYGITVAASVGKTGTTGQTTTIIYDDLVDMVDSLDAAYLDNPDSSPQLPGRDPGWMFGQTLRRTIRKIKDTAGRPIWTPSYDEGMSSATPDRLLGYPVYINNDMPTPAANAKSLAFGNFFKYMIRDVAEVFMLRFDDSAYMSKAQVGFLMWTRSGGNLMDLNSVKTYQHSAT